MNLTIGTRGSKLALWQSNTVKNLIEKSFPQITVSLNIIQTKGDKILDVALSKIGDKNLFTKEIENAILEKTADIAVHSLKDLPTELPNGLKLGAVLERAEYRDALISKSGKKLHELTSQDIIATSSLRRKAALLAYNPKFQIIDIRGNVDTRLKKMQDGYCDAMIMAAAGLQRLGFDEHITQIIEPNIMIPATSQGIIGIECRENDTEILEILSFLNHQATWQQAQAERSFLHAMQGGCQLPLGCISSIENETLTLKGFISSLQGTDILQFETQGSIENPAEIGAKLSQLFYNAGAERILKEIRNE
jgi:hydroxymethylbilane synthase